MLIILIIGAALAAGWFARAVSCSPSCRKAVYLTTPELEQAIWDRGFATGAALVRERGKVGAQEWARQVREADARVVEEVGGWTA